MMNKAKTYIEEKEKEFPAIIEGAKKDAKKWWGISEELISPEVIAAALTYQSALINLGDPNYMMLDPEHLQELSIDILKHCSNKQWFRNHYRCTQCKTEWQDEWDCMCDDRCPNCDSPMEPYYSQDISH